MATMVALMLLAADAHAVTINAANCAEATVRAALRSAVTGDTVKIPAGTCGWSRGMDSSTYASQGFDDSLINKSIQIQGAGAGTKAQCAVPGQTSFTCINDNTLKTNFPNVPHLIRWDLVSSGTPRITGISFIGGSNPGDGGNYGMILIRGSNATYRFDHNMVYPTMTSGLFFNGNVRGVVDHNFIDVSNSITIYVMHDSWGDLGAEGDNSWATPNTLGTASALYFENNTLDNDKHVSFQRYANDGWLGQRVVWRYNTYNNCTWANHGTESGGRQRGSRQFEVYNNSFVWDMGGNNFASAIGSRSGVGVVYNNTATITNGSLNVLFDVTNLRVDQAFAPWGRCGAGSVWDENSQANGKYCMDQVGTGQGDLLSGDFANPVNTAFGAPHWPRNMPDPTYDWNNTINATPNAAFSERPTDVVVGRDLIHSARPGYAPYAYPHPLAGGAAVADLMSPAKPTGFTLR